MKYIIDIDNTICVTYNSDYYNSAPIVQRIQKINSLFENGDTIIYWTARGGDSGKDWLTLTEQQLKQWNCKYHELWMNKPSYDIWVDDKALWIFK